MKTRNETGQSTRTEPDRTGQTGQPHIPTTRTNRNPPFRGVRGVRVVCPICPHVRGAVSRFVTRTATTGVVAAVDKGDWDDGF
jgi:hypothetical protein